MKRMVYTVQEFHHGTWNVVFWYKTEAIAIQHMNTLKRGDSRIQVVLMSEREAKKLFREVSR